MIENFHGNRAVVDILEEMMRGRRIHHTMLFAGPAGVGKATLARRFAAVLLGDSKKIERDDLSLADNQAVLAEREKWASDKRAEDPLVFKRLIYEMRFDEVSAMYALFGAFFVGRRLDREGFRKLLTV